MIIPGSGMGCLIYFDLCFDFMFGYSQNNQNTEAAWLGSPKAPRAMHGRGLVAAQLPAHSRLPLHRARP